ncbi:hypothetical protein TMU01_02970 [Tenuibacillus multivorans]|uniref:Conserved hypothetical tiny transmembrane protein n=1 Tax=Tenuibacillus multivorans TaxID=237069 RepID=A0A1G9YFR5_9BACI|nr:hypothetical protein TMU01_02970 [Tenuibacillus multivorans]SDN07303.1 conserved hypothetical tiny transmembrane protein [Tenuibacillus multivorans]
MFGANYGPGNVAGSNVGGHHGGYGGYGGYNNFALIVVLFILLIIVGAAFYC